MVNILLTHLFLIGEENTFNILSEHKFISIVIPFNILRYLWECMLEAVAQVHRLRLIHADIKPANFLLARTSCLLSRASSKMEYFRSVEHIFLVRAIWINFIL